jgi:hypothetical protein
MMVAIRKPSAKRTKNSYDEYTDRAGCLQYAFATANRGLDLPAVYLLNVNRLC